jgi:RNA polymerase sigma-70 factor (ECF subfamily)
MNTMDEYGKELVGLLPRLRRFALSLTCDPTDADDLVQAACEKGLASADQWQPGTRLDSWMFRIMQNHWIDLARARKSRGVEVEGDMLDQLPDDAWNRRMDARLTLERVLPALQQLPSAMRAVIGLVTVDGMSSEEAARVLGVPIGTVMSRLARGRLELMRRLNEKAVQHA